MSELSPRWRLLFPCLVLLLFSSSIQALDLTENSGDLPNDGTTTSDPSNVLRKPDCREIHHSKDQCGFYKLYCGDEDDGFISYLGLYFCQLGDVRPIAVILCFIWLAELFTTLGTVAGDFFAVNISTIARALNTPDTLAGVTFLALGNGAPDIFSTIAAMQSGSHGMAIGELLGAAAFITSVVAGSMALIGPFSVFRASLLRDIIFLAATVSFLLMIMIRGEILLWHCAVMFGFYVIYVLVVMAWHWCLWRQKQSSKAPQTQDEAADEESSTPVLDERSPLIPQRDTYLPQNGDEHQLTAPEPHYRSLSLHNSRDDTGTHWHRSAIARIISALGLQDEPTSQDVQILPKIPADFDRSLNEEDTDQDSNLELSGLPPAQKRLRGLRRHVRHAINTLFPSLLHFRKDHFFRKILDILLIPSTLVLKLTVPVVDTEKQNQVMQADRQPENYHESWEQWLFILQTFVAPQFMLVIVFHQAEFPMDGFLIPSVSCLGGSAVVAALVLLTTTASEKPVWHKLIVVPGFILSVAWIATVADETVAVFTALGVIGGVSETVLGLTVFAVGNSLDDLAANISIARHRHPVMALAACFGGPLLNILIGVSISGFLLYGKQVATIDLRFNNSLYGTAYMVLGTLVAFPIMMLFTGWRMTRIVAFSLIAIWVIGTAVNLGLHINA